MPANIRLVSYLIMALTLPRAVQSQFTPIELYDGDRVVFIGDGLFENELDAGYLEYVLTTAWPGRNISFRNIGWSGDTPAGISRDHFTNPPTPYDHLIDQITATQPTVAFLGYGAHLAYEGDGAVDVFLDELAVLLDTLETMDTRVVLWTPAPHEPETSRAPQVDARNHRIAQVSKRLEQLASDHGYPLVNLYAGLLEEAQAASLKISDNGYHLNGDGYYLAGTFLIGHLRGEDKSSTGAPDISYISIDLKKTDQAANIANLEQHQNGISFFLPIDRLPIPLPKTSKSQDHTNQTISIKGLKKGKYTLWIGNKRVAAGTAKDFARGLSVSSPHLAQADALQRLIQKKNKTYFYQYRPQNETYLVGFREYEQGQNARELQLLEPLIGEMENQIGRLRKPRELMYRVVAE